MKRKIYFLMVFVWCCLIYSFSAADGTESAGTSGVIAETIVKIVVPDFETKEPIDQEAIMNKAHLIICKVAHFCEYAILGIFASLLLSTYALSGRRRCFLAWVFATTYAVTDEIHQIVVPGREAAIKDVGIDALGALCGVLFLYIMESMIQKIRRTDKKVNEVNSNGDLER